MSMSAETDQFENSLKVIRKLRKKLRQIERLESTKRDLTPEESMKLSCKHDIRANLQLLVSVIGAANISFDSTKTDDSFANEDHDSVSLADPNPAEAKAAIKDSVASNAMYILQVHRDEENKYNMPSSEAEDNEKIIVGKKRKISEHEKLVDDKPSRTKKAVKLRPKLRKTWRNSQFEVTALEGHNDNVLAVDADEEWIVSASRDTSLKLWDVESCTVIRSMGGHCEAVTAIVLLSAEQSDALRQAIDRSSIEIFADLDERECDNERMAISGSTDCTIRLWLLPRGLCIKSIYNYNPVSAIAYMELKKFIFVGSTSGNLTVYNLCTSQQIYSSAIHQGQITQLKILQEKLYSSSAVGSIKIWNINSEKQQKEKTENLRFCNLEFEVTSAEFGFTKQYCYDTHSQFLPEREINSFTIYRNLIYFGDDGPNIKTIDLNSDKVCKIRNHKLNVPGITDSLTVTDELLLSTSYDLDTGIGSINVRSLHDECYGSYVASFCHSSIPRLLSMVVRFQNEDKYLVTAGEKLLLWKLRNHVEKSDEREQAKHTITLKGQNVVDLGKIATDSDNPSDYESSETESEGKWWWQKQLPFADPNPTKIQQVEEDDVDSEDETECNESSNSIEDGGSTANYFPLWEWCNLI